jgi:hypothetical protein
MTDSETIWETHSVVHAIPNPAFSNAKIAQAGVDFDVRLVLLRNTNILRCTE